MPKLFSTVPMRATKSSIMGASFDKTQTSQNHRRPAKTPSIPDRQTQGKKRFTLDATDFKKYTLCFCGLYHKQEIDKSKCPSS